MAASDMKKYIKMLEALVPNERQAVRILVPMSDARTADDHAQWCRAMVNDLPVDRNLSKIVTRLLEEGVCQRVVEVMLEYPESPSIRLEACRAINWLTFRSPAHAEDSRACLYGLGALEAILGAMQSGIPTNAGEGGNPVLVVAAAGALANVAYGSDARKHALCSLRVPESLLAAMRYMPESASVLRAALRALRNLVRHC